MSVNSRQTFVDEVVRQLEFLRVSEKFAGPDVQLDPALGTVVSVRHQRSVMIIEVSLETADAEGQQVVLTGLVDGGGGQVQRREISRAAVQTNRQMVDAVQKVGHDIRATTVGMEDAKPIRRLRFGRPRSNKNWTTQ